LEALIPNPPPGTIIYKFVAGNFQLTTFDDLDLVWAPADTTIDFGAGAFIRTPANAAAYNITWVGEVAEGNPITNPVAPGFSIKSAKVPQSGGITTIHNFQPTPGDIVYKFDEAVQNFVLYTFDDLDLVWAPEEPTLSPSESVLILSRATTTVPWNRNFDVTP
jgi:hypothetical protein